MSGPTVENKIEGGSQHGIIGAAVVTAGSITFINNYGSAAPELSPGPEAVAACPYPGLSYFGPDDADRFFGRDEAISQLVTAVSRQPLTALVGASGSGKSSVVLAGLAPRLHRGGGWRFSYFRIGHELDYDPFLALARALVPFYVNGGDETERLRQTRMLATDLRSGALTPKDVFATCRNQNKGSRILLIADQFEEAFTLIGDEAVRNRFIDVLLAGFTDPPSGGAPDVCLMLTLRADFYGRALLNRPLSDAFQGHVENLGPMKREELRTAIVRPAELAGVSFDPGLVETLLDEVDSKPGSLPLLQFALREMWERQANQRITRESYDAIGGVQGALARRAEAIFVTLTENGANVQMQKYFQRLFTRLVTLGEGQQDTRRIADRSELGDEAWSLAQRLAGENNRLVVTNAPAGSHETAEVVHEALIRHWPKLADWIDHDRAFLSWLRQIQTNIDLWSADPSDEGPLLRGGLLAQAIEWRARRPDDLSPTEKGFIDASIAFRRREEDAKEAARQAELSRQRERAEDAGKLAAEQRRRARQARIFGLVAGGIACIAVLLMALSGYYAWLANRGAKQSLSRQLAAQSLVDIDIKPQRSLLLAVESIRLARDSGIYRSVDAARLLHTLLGATGGVPLNGHTGAVKAVAFRPDGGAIATAGDDGTIRLWNPSRPLDAPVVLSGHQGAVTSVAYTQDGSRLVSAGADGTTRVWDASRPEKAAVVLAGHKGAIRALAIGPDSHFVATGGDDGTVLLWDLRAADPSAAPVVLLGHEKPVTAATFSRTGRWLVTGSNEDHIVELWDMTAADPAGAGRRLSHGERASDGGLNGLAFSPDERRLAVALGYGVQMWDLTATDPPAAVLFKDIHGQWISALGFSADGRWFVSGADGTVILRDLASAEGSARAINLTGHRATVKAVAFDPTGRWLATAGGDQTVRLWDLTDTAKPSIVLEGHEAEINALAFSPDGGQIVTGSNDRQARLWDIPEASLDRIVMNGGDAHIRAVAFSPDATRLVAVSNRGNTRLWDVSHPENKPLVLWEGAAAGTAFDFLSVSFSPDGHWLAAATSQDQAVRLWDIGAADPAAAVSALGPVHQTTRVVFSPDRHWLVSEGWNGEVNFWNLAAGRPKSAPEAACGRTPEPAQGLAFSADGRAMVTGSHGRHAFLWRLADGNPCSHAVGFEAGPVPEEVALSPDGKWIAATNWEPDYRAMLWHVTDSGPPALAAKLQFTSRVMSVAFSPDGHRMAAGSTDHTVQLVDLMDPARTPISLREHQERVLEVRFSPDSLWLASLSEDRTIRLWDVDHPTDEPAVLRDPAAFSGLSFSSDGNWLATGNIDGTVRLWWLKVDQLIGLACRTAGRNLTDDEWQTFRGGSTYRATCSD